MAVKKGATGCELCGGVAAVHCAADSAFLCLSCDAKVHGANFLASRHLRRHLDEDARSGSSELSSCVSTADSAAAPAAVGRGRKRRARAEVILEGWAKRMGFAPGAAAVASTLRALGRSRRRARPAPRRDGHGPLVEGRRRRRGGRAAPSAGGELRRGWRARRRVPLSLPGPGPSPR